MKALLVSTLCLALGGCVVDDGYGAGYSQPGYYDNPGYYGPSYGPGYYAPGYYYAPGTNVWLNNGGYPYYERNYPRGYHDDNHHNGDGPGGDNHGSHHH